MEGADNDDEEGGTKVDEEAEDEDEVDAGRGLGERKRMDPPGDNSGASASPEGGATTLIWTSNSPASESSRLHYDRYTNSIDKYKHTYVRTYINVYMLIHE